MFMWQKWVVKVEGTEHRILQDYSYPVNREV